LPRSPMVLLIMVISTIMIGIKQGNINFTSSIHRLVHNFNYSFIYSVIFCIQILFKIIWVNNIGSTQKLPSGMVMERLNIVTPKMPYCKICQQVYLHFFIHFIVHRVHKYTQTFHISLQIMYYLEFTWRPAISDRNAILAFWLWLSL
jgi:hypothetical protein